MEWKLVKNKPLCPQIAEQICVSIAKNIFKPNEKLMSVREVALEAGVNPNTVQKAFEQLEGMGIIYSVRGSGWFVEDNVRAAKESVEKLAEQKTREYIEDMKALGFLDKEIIKRIEENAK